MKFRTKSIIFVIIITIITGCNNMTIPITDIKVKGGSTKDRDATIQNQVGTDAYQTNLGEPIKRTTPTFTDANTKYFDKTGDDTTGTGTTANPYLTIGKAITECDGAAPAFIYVVCQDSGTYEENDIISITKGIAIYAKSGETSILKLSNFTKVSQNNELADLTLFSETYNEFYYARSGLEYLTTYDIPGKTNIDTTYDTKDLFEFNSEIYVLDGLDILRRTTSGGSPLSGAIASGTPWSAISDDGTTLVLTSYISGVTKYSTDGSSFATGGTFAGILSMAMKDGIVYFATSSKLYYTSDLFATTNEIETIAVRIAPSAKSGIVVENNIVYFWTENSLYKINSNYTITEIASLQIETFRYDSGYYYIIDRSTNSIKRYNENFVFIDTIITESTFINSIAIKNGILIYGTSTDLYQILLTPLFVRTTSSLQYNGYEFDGNNLGSGNITLSSLTAAIAWCTFKNQIIPTALNWYDPPVKVTFGSTVICNSEFGIVTNYIDTIDTCLLYNITNKTIALEDSAILEEMERITAYNCADFVRTIQSSSPGFDFKDNIIMDLQGQCIQNEDIPADYQSFEDSIYNVEMGQVDIDEASTEVTRALFRDINNEDFRLKVVEAQASNGEYYPFDSPGKDFGCYIFNYTNNDTEFEFIRNLKYAPKSATLELVPIREHISEDSEGDIHKSIFDWRYNITLEWPDSGYVDEDMKYIIERLIIETKPFSIYLNGDTGIVQSSGKFDRDNLLLTDFTRGEGNSTVKYPWNRYRGFWLTLTYLATDYDYFIESCYADQINLTDLKANGLTGGEVDVDYKITYINAICPENTFSMREEWFSKFIMNPDSNRQLSFQGFSLPLRAYHKALT